MYVVFRTVRPTENKPHVDMDEYEILATSTEAKKRYDSWWEEDASSHAGYGPIISSPFWDLSPSCVNSSERDFHGVLHVKSHEGKDVPSVFIEETKRDANIRFTGISISEKMRRSKKRFCIFELSESSDWNF